jgi:hypothetical protein
MIVPAMNSKKKAWILASLIILMTTIGCHQNSKKMTVNNYHKWCANSNLFHGFPISGSFEKVYVKAVTPACKVLRGESHRDTTEFKNNLLEEMYYIQLHIKIPKGKNILSDSVAMNINKQMKASQMFLFKEESFLADTSQTYIAEFKSPVSFDKITKLYGSILVDDRMCEFNFDSTFFNQLPTLIIQ